MVQVRIDDCIKALTEYVELGKTFNYVINDLTDIPINVSLQGECNSEARQERCSHLTKRFQTGHIWFSVSGEAIGNGAF